MWQGSGDRTPSIGPPDVDRSQGVRPGLTSRAIRRFRHRMMSFLESPSALRRVTSAIVGSHEG